MCVFFVEEEDEYEQEESNLQYLQLYWMEYYYFLLGLYFVVIVVVVIYIGPKHTSFRPQERERTNRNSQSCMMSYIYVLGAKKNTYNSNNNYGF